MVKSSESDVAPSNLEMSPEKSARSLGPPQFALLLGALMLALYLRTLAPGLLAGDPGEFQFAAWHLGIAHPTGYPLYLMLGHLWQKLLYPTSISPATALNAFSALCSACAVGLFFLLQFRWIGGPQSIRLVAAGVGTLFFGLNPTFWNQSLIAEVYSLHMLLVVLIVLTAQRYISRQYIGKQQTDEVDAPSSAGAPTFWLLCGLIGLSLTHHAMTVWLLPGLLLALIWTWRTGRPEKAGSLQGSEDGVPWPTVAIGLIALLIPLLLYLYIPLRSGPLASPWYHQPLGEDGSGVLTLYENSWPGFIQFFTGQSISVGFRSSAEALNQIGFAGSQWLIHFTWLGLALMAVGLGSLVVGGEGAKQRRPLLPITGVYFLLQQGFNLFYDIGDIFVYYIPLYWIGALWAGLGVGVIGLWLQQRIEGLRAAQNASYGATAGESGNRSSEEAAARRLSRESRRASRRSGQWTAETAAHVSALLVALFGLLPMQVARTYFPQIDQSANNGTWLRWQEILNAGPPKDAILVSNDRNEIVPLFYIQHVDQHFPNLSGLFPLIAPEERFADIGSTLSTALDVSGDRPVVLIKPMPGIEALFRTGPVNGMAHGLFNGPIRGPLVKVFGAHDASEVDVEVGQAYGPLTLIGYEWHSEDSGNAEGDEAGVTLLWRVDEEFEGNYTTSVQIFDAAGEKIAQDDRPPGGVYYPTSLWKVGELLQDAHPLSVPPDSEPATLLINMYRGEGFDPLAPALEIPLP